MAKRRFKPRPTPPMPPPLPAFQRRALPLSTSAMVIVENILRTVTQEIPHPGRRPSRRFRYPDSLSLSATAFGASDEDWIAAAPVAARALADYLEVHRLPFRLILDESQALPRLLFERHDPPSAPPARTVP